MGWAYLPDGSLIDYNEYIQKHPHWQNVKKARFEFDDGRCVICHRDLHGQVYQTHHLNYFRLGHEAYKDVVTLCPKCHKEFHETWEKSQFWRGRETGHWSACDIEATAKICAKVWKTDRLICRDVDAPNMCNKEQCRQAIEDYFRDNQIARPVVVDPNDIQLFVRNKRYELFFEAEDRGLTVEQFLDEYYGQKVRGKNPLRQEAGKKNGPFDHTPESFHRHYNENKNILMLMQEVKRYAET